MKTLKFILPFILFFTILLSCNNKNSNEIIINGILDEVEDGVVVTLGQIQGNMSIPYASDTVKNGRFHFTYIDSIHYVKQINLTARGDGFPPAWLDLWIKPGARVTIKGKDKLLRTWDVQSNISEQKEYDKYVETARELLVDDQKNMRDAYKLFDLIGATEDEMERIACRSKIDSLYKICGQLWVEVLERELSILEKPTFSPVWFEKLLSHAKTLAYMKDTYPDIQHLTSIYNRLDDKQKNTDIGKEIAIYLFPPTVVTERDKMCDADLIDLGGNKKNLADYSGKYRLLDSWSRGCAPCIAAIPEMKEISEKYKDKLQIIGINTDPPNIWKEFSGETEVAGINLNDPKGDTGLMLNYGITGIPHYVLIDSDDTIVASWSGYGKGMLLGIMEELIK